MQQQWSFQFNQGGFVNPEEIEARRQQLLKKLVDEKRCIICRNTFLVNDQITFCSIKKECVDMEYGTSCDNWDPLKINN